jgi:hypothetical protein
LLKEVLPTDELEILRVISHAPFYAVSEGVLIRGGPKQNKCTTIEHFPSFVFATRLHLLKILCVVLNS